ncbi:uncharacterized protein KY384_004414 [Bacidia gigantensis]|uniref:uncharacterized protein n=1 Tax=Bacidia gigantensis TaxID=2732470 RepID=UPI001D03D233|nr:uncharacterized protein KY384_004414 [Bacidia gigantensis]KAG8531057.1 hypothetical protein KY384_004414 [Bacidia gigantensis]
MRPGYIALLALANAVVPNFAAPTTIPALIYSNTASDVTISTNSAIQAYATDSTSPVSVRETPEHGLPSENEDSLTLSRRRISFGQVMAKTECALDPSKKKPCFSSLMETEAKITWRKSGMSSIDGIDRSLLLFEF